MSEGVQETISSNEMAKPVDGPDSAEKVTLQVDPLKEINEEDSWFADCSDEESYSIQSSDIKQLYEMISRHEPMVLEWKIPKRRRSPTPPRGVTVVTKDVSDGQNSDVIDNTSTTILPGYEFDEPSSDSRPARQPARRSTGITPRSNQKRVARLDKIMDDMVRHKKMDDEAHSVTNSKSPQRRSSPKS